MLGLDHPARRRFDRHEVELVDETLEGVVGRAVVDDDHLELRVVDREQRANRVRKTGALVVRGNEDADPRREPGAGERVDVVDLALSAAAARLREPDDQQPPVHEPQQREVRAARQDGDSERGLERHEAALCLEPAPVAEDQPSPGALGRRAAQPSAARVEDLLRPSGLVVADQRVDVPDVLQHEGGAAPQRLVVAVERRLDGRRRVVAGRDERLAGGLAHPPRRVGEEWDEVRRGRAPGDGRRGSARLCAHLRMRVLEEPKRMTERRGRAGRSKRLERGAAHVRRRVRRTGRDVLLGEHGIAREQAHGVGPDDGARMAEQRREPWTRSRREPVEHACHADGVLARLRERLDETVDRPVVPLREVAEGRYARRAELRDVAPQRLVEQGLGRAPVRVAQVDQLRDGRAVLPLADLGDDRERTGAAPVAEPTDEQRENEQRPGAARNHADDHEAGSTIHAPLLSAPRTGDTSPVRGSPPRDLDLCQAVGPFGRFALAILPATRFAKPSSSAFPTGRPSDVKTTPDWI